MRVLRYGERALLLEVGSHLVAEYAAAIESLGMSEIVCIVPASETVLVQTHSANDLGSLELRLHELQPKPSDITDVGEVVVEIDYDGPDLAWIAEQVGLSVAEVIAFHSGSMYRVQFCGFSPGFGYLSGLDPLLQLPRRTSPRTSVPAGSVSIAGAYTAVYPTASPGGWHLIGSTDVVLFDPDRFEVGQSPALFRPGVSVRFVPR